MRPFRRRHVRSHGERGAGMVEGAIAAPIFFLLIFATFDFGLGFRQFLSISSASSNAARTASAAGSAATADYQILQEIARSTKAIKSEEIRFIVVFKATGPSSSIETDTSLQACLSASVSNLCNRYVPSDLALGSSSFGSCTSGVDHYWCPANRRVAVTDPPDYVGVYITSRYRPISGIVGSTHDFSQQTIYRMEAQSR